MANTYNYTIDRMDVVDTTTYSNYVVRVYYSYIGIEISGELTYEGKVSGNVNYQVEETEFTPYDELTESQVIGWVESTLTDKQKALNKQFVDNAIENEKNPKPTPHKEPLPW